jgi:pyruvate dehydrogenase E2 component (dihydrolipoamide acetyltransferase)
MLRSVPVEIRMPELSSDMTEADLIAWLVKPGDRVEAGDLIAELETEKSTVEFESPVSGILLEIVVPEGTNAVEVGTLLALFEDGGAAAPAPASTPTAAPGPAPSPAPVPAAQPAPPPASSGSESAATSPPAIGSAQEAVAATALARRVAQQSGVDLVGVAGTGPGGRIVKADVEAAAGGPAGDMTTQGTSVPAPADSSFESDTPFSVQPLSRMRRTIASRLQESKQTIPHFYLHVDCEIDELLDLRKKLNTDERRISVNDFIVRAAALALIEVPDANVSYSDEGLIRYERADVAVAVATDGGLVTPLVREADRKELEALSDEIRELATRAREGNLTPKEYRGGSFTVSNLGMFGIDSVYAIVNPPQSCILGVGAGRERPVVRDGELAVGHLMTVTLSADHRAVDGAIGAQLLAAIKRRIEDPLEMLL